MQIMPELAVALRRELEEQLTSQESAAVALSTWAKVRPARAEGYVRALQQALAQPLPVVLWQRGAWACATEARDTIGGELTTPTDMEPLGQLWLFDMISLPATVKKRFCLPPDARIVARILLPVTGSPEEGATQHGTAMGYLFRTAPSARGHLGTPFLRLFPDLYPGAFIADPHINFVAANRYAQQHHRPVRAPGKGRVFVVEEHV